MKNIIKIIIVIFLIIALINVFTGCEKSKNLIQSIRDGNTEEALKLIEDGANVNEYYPWRIFQPLLFFVEEGSDLPLEVACGRGNVQMVQALLEHGADPNKYYKGGFSAVEAVRGDPDTRLELYKLLVKYNADVNLYGGDTSALCDELYRNSWNNSMNEEEEYEKTIEIICFLYDNGGKCLYRGNEINVLLYSAMRGMPELVSIFLNDYAIDVNVKSETGKTALMYGAEDNEMNLCQMLLEYGADKTVVDVTGKTAYDYAVENGYIELAELLKP